MYSIRSARSNSRGLAGIAALGALLIAGCGKPSYQLETAPVTGKVTLDGAPFTGGYVVFVPARGRMSSGSIQPDGSFAMSTYQEGDGAQVGTHPVIITPIPSDEVPRGQKRTPVPIRYTKAGTSGFNAQVKPGEDNYLELDMTSKEQKK